MLDPTTNMYVPRKVNYPEYLAIEEKRRAIIDKQEEQKHREDREDKLVERIINPLSKNLKPLVEAGVRRMQGGQGGPPHVKTSKTAQVQAQGQAQQQQQAPLTFKCQNCKQDITVTPDEQGNLPQSFPCPNPECRDPDGNHTTFMFRPNPNPNPSQ
jgi:hypothetical protein